MPSSTRRTRVKCPKCGGVIQIPTAAPDYEVVEDTPPTPVVAKRPQIVDEDEKPVKKMPRVVDDEDEDEKPRRKTARANEDDEEDERPRKKRAKAADDDDEERPRKKSRRDESDEDDEPKKRKGKNGKPASKAGLIRLVIGLALLLILLPTAAAIFYFKFFANNDTAAATSNSVPTIPGVRPGPVGPGPNPGTPTTPSTTPTTTPSNPDTGPKLPDIDLPVLSADGTRVIGLVGSFSGPDYIGEWDVATGKKLGEFGRNKLKDTTIFRVAYSGSTTQDSKVAAYASTAKKFLVWDAKTHELVKEIPITLDDFDKSFPTMKFFAFTADASALLMHSNHVVVRVDIASGKQEYILDGKVEADLATFAASVDTVVCPGFLKFPGKLRVTPLKNPNESQDIELPKQVENSSQQVVSADGSTVAFRTTDPKTEARQIVLFDLKAKKVIDTVQMPGDSKKVGVWEMALSDDGTVLAFCTQSGGGNDPKLSVYTAKDKANRQVPVQLSSLPHFSLAGNGSKLAIGYGFKPMTVLDVATLR